MNVKIYDTKGGETITNTSAHAGDWGRLQMLTSTTIAALTGNVSNLTGIAIPAGTVITGSFSSITLTSGSLIAYDR